MAKTYSVTEKGQVTIPAPLRRRLNITPGSQVVFEAERGAARLRPARGLLAIAGTGKRGVPKRLLGLPWRTVRKRAWEAAARDVVRRGRLRTK